MPKLSFISDFDFDRALNHVTQAIDDALIYEQSVKAAIENDDIFSSRLFSNSIDPISMRIGMGLSSDVAWLSAEIKRQLYKTYEQKIGEFHQIILGSVDGWMDLGVGDDQKVDLCKEDETVYIELKNKFNTCNSDALLSVENKLLKLLDKKPLATAYWAFIVPTTKLRQGNTLWYKSGKKEKHPRLRKAWGAEVYRLVTGDNNALHEMYSELENSLQKNRKSDNLDAIAERIIALLAGDIEKIKEEIFYRTVADNTPE